MSEMDTPLDPSTSMLLQQSLKQTEEDLASGKLAADVAVDSLADMDCFYFSARQADGTRVTGLLARTRVPPHPMFVVGPMIPVTGETYRILAERLPPPVLAKAPLPKGQPAPKTPVPLAPAGNSPRPTPMNQRQRIAVRAGEAARKAAADARSEGIETQHMAGNPQITRHQAQEVRKSTKAIARPLRTPPGALVPEDIAPSFPPSFHTGGGEKIPQG